MRVELVLRGDPNGRRGRNPRLRGGFVAQVGREVVHDGREVRTAQPPLRSVDRIGRNEHLRGAFGSQPAFEFFRDFEDDVGLSRFDAFHRFFVRGRDVDEVEIGRRRGFFGQSPGVGRAIVVDDGQVDVAYLHTGRPRQYQHCQARHEQDQPGQERVAADLFELFFDQVFQHGYSSLYLNFLRLTTTSTTAIALRIATSLSA